MSQLPYPETIRNELDNESRMNRSLLFNRCFSFYDDQWQITKEDRRQKIKEGRLQFFESFLKKFMNTDTKPFNTFLECRKSSLDARSAVRVSMCSTSRLVIGLGLPHPTETSLLFDRLTGCPYLPGSSVKGMVHQAARLTGSADFTVDGFDRSFWTDNVARIFGSNMGENGYIAKGEMIFYDAFPSKWPILVIDVLTPHYSDYYGDPTNTVFPGDWENPNPVRFLTVEVGTVFKFWFRGLNQDPSLRRKDEEAIQALLPIALDWLGIGGKKSSGYGTFLPEPQARASQPRTSPALADFDERKRVASVTAQPRKKPDRPQPPSHLSKSRKTVSRSFPKPSQNKTVHEITTQEVVTLIALTRADKAIVITDKKKEIPCKGIPMYPPPEIGRRLRAVVRRINDIPKDAQFKGWL